MSIRISIFAITLISLTGSLFSMPVQAQSHPVCQSTSSDSDGDGFGWENRAPCIVTADTSTAPAEAVCVDDDGDGYGWDGSQVCRIDVMCHDTAPIGDGWGWDGSNSCEIAAYDAPFNELEILKNVSRPGIQFNVEIPEAIAVCDVDGVRVEFRLLADGTAERTAEGQDLRRGSWSTGFEVSNGFLHLRSVGARWLVLAPDNSITLNDFSSRGSFDCFWE